MCPEATLSFGQKRSDPELLRNYILILDPALYLFPRGKIQIES